jgi:hypothetical protein
VQNYNFFRNPPNLATLKNTYFFVDYCISERQKDFQITEDEVCLIVSTQKIGDYERK